MADGWRDARGRIPDAFLGWVTDLAATLGWSQEQTEDFIRVPDEILDVLVADLTASLGWSREEADAFILQNACEYAPGLPRVVVVAEKVQQALHDGWVDTAWPACPDHPNHPLRLSETLPATWTCPLTRRPVCPLGRLSTVIHSR
jgi:hypothetical protein